MATYKYGATGFVEIHDDCVRKFSVFNEMYWLNEHIIMMYLATFRTDNIIKVKRCEFTYAKKPNATDLELYYMTELPVHAKTLNERNFYNDGDMIQVMLDLSSALAFLHSNDIWHRDIKPDNILVSDEGRAVLIDFSHAFKKVVNVTPDSEVVTYYYRAPEVFDYQQRKGPAYMNSIDIWSLGLVFADMVTKSCVSSSISKAYHNGSDEEADVQATISTPKFKNRLKRYMKNMYRELPHYEEYWSWIGPMVSKNPAKRPTALDVYEQIKEFADENKIDYIEPVNYSNPVEEIKFDYQCDRDLLNKCLVEYEKLAKDLVLSINHIEDTFVLLISNGEIKKENYHTYVPVIYKMMFNTIYDDKWFVDPKSPEASIITKLVEKYSIELFTRKGTVFGQSGF